jgi:protein TonB
MSRRPQVPELRLPRTHQSSLGGTAVSLAVHGFLVFLIVWTGRQVAGGDFRAAGGPGPLGGGGGGGGGEVRYLEIQPYVTPSNPLRTEADQTPAVELPIPRPELREISPETRQIRIARPTGPVVPAQAIGRGPGSGGGPGAGTGSGGGVGTGRGTGVGSGIGPGTGGDGGDGYAPRSRQMLLPPDAPPSIKGREFRVRFWINERGRVTRIEVEPPIPDASYRREFHDRMRQFRFYPARDADGNPIASYYDAWITP